ncbi:type II secretion system F family protein [Sneathiella aquimaris]|uniref:type II secretion system F family protein n=1 Tax=Sneathiella aquimaris TaxID=2599305 RepID=UPI00146A15E8|nr:type II secretion system F family protein [Sneathiella aquimaris]
MIGAEDQMMMTLVVGGATLIVALILGFALMGGNEVGANTKRRLAEVGRGDGPMPTKPTRRNTARLNDQQSSIKILDMIVRKFVPNPAKLRSRLEKTGMKLTIAEYSLMVVVVIAFALIILTVLYDFGMMLAIPAAIFCGLFFPHFVIGYLGKRRINKFMKTFPEAIELLVRSLRAGLPISEAIVTVGTDAPDPVGEEFRGIADAVRMGKSLEESLWDVAKRIDLPDFKFLIIAISIQRETGGNLAETLGGLANTLRKRRQIKLKIKAMSSEARASAWIIGSLPFIMFFLLWLANDGYVMALVEDPRGVYMIGVGLVMIASGVGVMAKMVRFEI